MNKYILFSIMLLANGIYFPESNIAYAQTDYVWNLTSGQQGSWHTSQNWTPNGIPGPNDHAIINNGLVLVRSETSVSRLSYNGGLLTLDNTLSVSSVFEWGTGTLTGGTSGELIIQDRGTWNMTTGKGRSVGGSVTITNRGIARWSSGNISNNQATDVTINNHGSVVMEDDLTIGSFNAYWGTFNNFGRFVKNGGRDAGTIEASIRLINTGIIDIRSGNLLIRSGAFNSTETGDYAGQFAIGSGNMLQIIGGNHRINDKAEVIGPDGILSASAGSLVLSSPSVDIRSVTVTGGSVTTNRDYVVNTVTLTGGALSVNGQLSITDTFTWNGGTVTGGAAGQLNIPPGSAWLMTGGSGRALGGSVTINNQGTATWSAGNIGNGQATNVTINNAGLFDLQGDLNLGSFNTFWGTFNNTGTFRKSAGTGSALFETSIRLINAGTLEVASGTLNIRSGTFNTGETLTSSGTFIIGKEATLQFFGGNHSLNDSSLITGQEQESSIGTLSLTGGTLSLNGEVELAGLLSVAGGTLSVNKAYVIPRVNLTGGALSVNGQLSITDTFTWNGGTVTGGAAGQLNIPPGSAWLMTGGSGRALGGSVTINNQGTATWSAGNIGNGQATNVTINNAGLFDLQGDLNLGSFNAFWGTFNNTGTFRKSAGTGAGLFETSIRLVNPGAIEVLSGTLNIRSGTFNTGETLSYTGSFIIAEQAIVQITGGNHSFDDQAPLADFEQLSSTESQSSSSRDLNLNQDIGPAGLFSLTNGSLTINSDHTIQRFNFSNGTLSINGQLTVANTFTWDGGTVTGGAAGQLNIPAGSVWLMTGGSGRTLGGSVTINNQGTATWSAGNIGNGQATDVTINNAGVFDLQADLVLGSFNAFWGTFNNTGTFRKSAGAGAGLIDASVRLINNGTLEVGSGTLNIRSGSGNTGETLTSSGTFIIGKQATLQFLGGNHSLDDSSLIIGQEQEPAVGTLSLAGGILSLNGLVDLAGTLAVSNGTLSVNKAYTIPLVNLTGGALSVNGQLSITDTFTWNGGTVTGGAAGQLNIPPGSAWLMTGGSGRALGGSVTITNQGTATWSAGNIGNGQATDVTINNTGLFDLQGDLTLGSFNAFWGTFNNTGTFRKSAGAGTGLFDASIRLVNPGAIEVLSGTLGIRSGSGNTGETLSYTGSFIIAEQAIVQITGGNHLLAEQGIVTGSGTFNHTGGTFTNQGSFKPGRPVGVLTYGGNFAMSATTSIVEIDLAGTDAGNGYDQLLVTGNAVLNGTLSLRVNARYTPEQTDTFTVITCEGSCSGSFSNISVDPPDVPFGVIYEPGLVKVVPGEIVYSPGCAWTSLGSDNLWHNPVNWNCEGQQRIPTTEDDVVIDMNPASGTFLTVTMAENAEARSLTLGRMAPVLSETHRLTMTNGFSSSPRLLTLGSGGLTVHRSGKLITGRPEVTGGIGAQNGWIGRITGTDGVPVSMLVHGVVEAFNMELTGELTLVQPPEADDITQARMWVRGASHATGNINVGPGGFIFVVVNEGEAPGTFPRPPRLESREGDIIISEGGTVHLWAETILVGSANDGQTAIATPSGKTINNGVLASWGRTDVANRLQWTITIEGPVENYGQISVYGQGMRLGGPAGTLHTNDGTIVAGDRGGDLFRETGGPFIILDGSTLINRGSVTIDSTRTASGSIINDGGSISDVRNVTQAGDYILGFAGNQQVGVNILETGNIGLLSMTWHGENPPGAEAGSDLAGSGSWWELKAEDASESTANGMMNLTLPRLRDGTPEACRLNNDTAGWECVQPETYTANSITIPNLSTLSTWAIAYKLDSSVPLIAVNDTLYVGTMDIIQADLLRNDQVHSDSVTITSLNLNGTLGDAVIIDEGLRVIYSTPDNYEGIDQFRYTITGSAGDTASALVYVIIGPGLSADRHTIALYKFEEEDTGLVIDYSSSGNNATGFGTIAANGPLGRARYFDGIKDYIDMDAARLALQGSTEWTIEYVAAAMAPNKPPPGLINHSCGNGWVLFPQASTLTHGIKTNRHGGCAWLENSWLNVQMTPLDTLWHHYAMTYDESGNSLKVYKDGEILIDKFVDGVFLETFTNTARALIGRNDNNNTFQEGYADEVRVSSIARSPEEINRTFRNLNRYLGIGFNSPPVANNDTLRTQFNLPMQVFVLRNDSDPDGDLLKIAWFDDISNEGGQIVQISDSVLSYTPPGGFTGNDHFRYSITDGRDGTDTASVWVEVFPVRFEITAADLPGSRALAIDDEGALAGIVTGDDNAVSGFYKSSGSAILFNKTVAQTQIFGLNSGRMAGMVRVTDTTAVAHIFYPDGTTQPVGPPGNVFSIGYAINDQGWITGVMTDDNGRYRAFIWNGTEIITPDEPGSYHSTAFAINNSGTIAGMSESITGLQRAFSGNALAASAGSRAYSLNNAGFAAGSIDLGNALIAAVWDPEMNEQILQGNGDNFTEAYGINDAGWVVGITGTNSRSKNSAMSLQELITARNKSHGPSIQLAEDFRAILWIDGTRFDLNDLIDPSLGWTLLEAAAVNNLGQIAGTGSFNGNREAFILTPIDASPPTADNLFFNAIAGQSVYMQIPAGDPNVKLVHVSPATFGFVTIETDNQIRYEATPGFYGEDTFRYTVSNGRSVNQGTITVNVSEAVQLPEQLHLGQNYPNPFNPGTILPFELPVSGQVRIDIYDILGRHISTVMNQSMEAGHHQVYVDAGSLSTGTYMYRLTTIGGVITKKMTLLK